MNKKFTVVMDEVGKERLDTQTMLFLEVSSFNMPEYLSDFVGGNACLHESGNETKFEICEHSTNFRVVLNNPDRKKATLVSATTRDKQTDPLIPLPMAEGQTLRLHFENYYIGLDFKVRAIY